MSRAVFLSAGGDPFIVSLAMKLWKERWYNEVDKFWVNYNNHSAVPEDVAAEFLGRASRDPKVEIIHHYRGCGNGRPITEMTLVSREDLVMLCEDDFYVFNEGAVNECFQKIESDQCDGVGSPRFSCGVEIGEASQKKYGLDYTGYGDRGCNFWPTGFFCKRSDLLRTDLDFSSVTFTPGQYSKELDHTFETINHGDTFVWACIQLRAMGLRFIDVPAHKADPFEVQSKKDQVMNWHPTQSWFPWIHGGSLSSGLNGYLSGLVPDVSTDIAKQEIESRVAFWQMCKDTTDGYEEYKKVYQTGINNLIIAAQLDQTRINQKIELYRNLMRI